MKKIAVIIMFLMLAACTQKSGYAGETYIFGKDVSFSEEDGKTIVDSNNNPATGDVQVLNPEGKVVATFGLKSGKYHGKMLQYYDDGTLKSEEDYEEGLIIGTRTTFYPSGHPLNVENYVNGKLDDIHITYWDNNKLFREMFYKDGEVHGPLAFYREADGTLMALFLMYNRELISAICWAPDASAYREFPDSDINVFLSTWADCW